MPNATSVEDRWSQMLSNAEAIQREITENTPTLCDVTISTSTSHIVSMYWRAIRLNDGIIILLKAELPEEAAILARSLIEVSLNLRQLQAEPDFRRPSTRPAQCFSLSKSGK